MTGVYVDNVQCLGGKPGEAESAMQAISDRFKLLNIPFDVSYPNLAGELTTLGLTVNVRTKHLTPKNRRAWRLYLATHALAKRGKIRGEHMRIWLGHVVNHFQVMRSAYSSLSACYRFVKHSLGHRCRIWPSVRQELRVIAGLVLISGIDLGSGTSNIVHVSDSSEYGLALMKTRAPLEHIRLETLYREHWRFLEVAQDQDISLVPSWEYDSAAGLSKLVGDDEEHKISASGSYAPDVYNMIGSGRIRPSTPAAGLGSKTRFGQQLLAHAEARPRRVQRDFRKSPHEAALEWDEGKAFKTFMEGAIPAVSKRWSNPDRWVLVHASRWSDNAEPHITIKEAIVGLLGLRHQARSLKNFGKNVCHLWIVWLQCCRSVREGPDRRP